MKKKSAAKVSILLLCCLNVVSCRPQADKSGLSCKGDEVVVKFQECADGIGEEVEDSLDLKIGLEEEEQLICCHKLNVIKTVSAPVVKPTCQDNEGFNCRRHSDCLGGEILSLDGKVLEAKVTGSHRKVLEINPKNSLCNGDVNVCCKPPKAKPAPMTTVTPKRLETSEVYRACGRHNLDGLDIRIVDSTEGAGTTQVGEWPHNCVIFYRNSSGGAGQEEEGVSPRKEGLEEEAQLVGGASLIAPGILLTAAHKVEGKVKANLRVRCGVWDIKNEDPDYPSQERRVHTITIHPSYYPKQVYNDFALLHTDEDFVLAKHIGTVCLPKTPYRMDEFERAGCVATGFGKDKADGQYQRALKQVHLPLVQHQDCQIRLRTKKPATFELHESFVCAGGAPGGGDTCDGDGGGPLVCPAKGSDGDRFIQVGITAWGVKCNTPNIPGVYASIPDGLCFIDWATKCIDGSKFKDFYDVRECEGWISDEIERLRKRKSEIESQPESGRSEKLADELARIVSYIENAETLQGDCGR